MLAERRIRVAAVVANVPSICDFVVEAARELGFDDKAVHHCRLAVDEACTNVVEHGYAMQGGDQMLTVTCTQFSDQFVITIEDEGHPFDPTLLPDPDRTASIEERKPGGWGIYFIKKLMDKVAYQRNGSRNVLTLWKQLPLSQIYSPEPGDPALPIQITPLNPKVSMVSPRGQVDSATTKTLEAALLRQINDGRRGVILNLAGVSYLSSAGIKTLVTAWQRARDAKGDMVICAMTPRVREIVQVVGLDMVLTIFESQDAALDYFKVKR